MLKNRVFYETQFGRRSHLSIIVSSSGNIITYGWNLLIKNSGMNSIHSERNAIMRFEKLVIAKKVNNRKKYYMINYAFNKNGELKMSKPCLHCSKFLQTKSVIKQVFWTNETSTFDTCKMSFLHVGAVISSGELN